MPREGGDQSEGRTPRTEHRERRPRDAFLLLTMSSAHISHGRPWLLPTGYRCPVLLALTFKVPLLFPPTFTLILLPEEDFQSRKGKEMSDEQRTNPKNKPSCYPHLTFPQVHIFTCIISLQPSKTLLGGLCIYYFQMRKMKLRGSLKLTLSPGHSQ